MNQNKYEMRVFEYEGDWICMFPDLPGCSGVGDDPEDAIADGIEARDLWLEGYFEKHNAYPEPRHIYSKNYSGKFTLRVSESLHRELAIRAEEEGTSLNNYCNQLLAYGLGHSRTPDTVNVNFSITPHDVKKDMDKTWVKVNKSNSKVIELDMAV